MDKSKSDVRSACDRIYNASFSEEIITLKHYREIWLKSSSSFNKDGLFKYADPDFYFYRTTIGHQERNTIPLMKKIMCGLLNEYGYQFECLPADSNFDFVVCMDNKSRVGYRFSDFDVNDDINAIMEQSGVNSVIIIRNTIHGQIDKIIQRTNKSFAAKNLKVRQVNLEDIFVELFGAEEYKFFKEYIDSYLLESREITGYQSIKFLSSMNLATQKAFAEEVLKNWDYSSSKYIIINPKNPKLYKKQLYVGDYDLNTPIIKNVFKNYKNSGLYKALTGTEEFADSFITSEWLYHSLKGRKNFDYTALISGYLKSIEQLLQKIVAINVNNECIIAINKAYKEIAEDHGVAVYCFNKNLKKKERVSYNHLPKYPYIDFTSTQKQYSDSSIGTFEYFIRFNPHIVIDDSLAPVIADMISCFRTECRNGYFHTHNLDNWEIVENTRKNAILLYALLLGGCKMALEKSPELGILSGDRFDALCKAIREFSHYGIKFIFEYNTGIREYLLYDSRNNTIEYSNEGIEHYECLRFLKVDDFSIDASEKFNDGIADDQVVMIKRDSLPRRIYGIHIDGRLQEFQL